MGDRMVSASTFDRAVGKIAHRDDCTDPRPVHRTGRLGGTLALCASCGRFVALDEIERLDRRHGRTVPPQANPEPEPEPRRRKPPSLYYCRAHYHPVSPRGTGCPACAAEMVPKRRRPDPDTRAALAWTN